MEKPSITTHHGPGTLENPKPQVSKEEEIILELTSKEEKEVYFPAIDTLKTKPGEIKWTNTDIGSFVDGISAKKTIKVTYGEGYPKDESEEKQKKIERKEKVSTQFLNPEQAALLFTKGYKNPATKKYIHPAGGEHTIIYIPMQDMSIETPESKFVSANEENDMLPVGAGHIEAPQKTFTIDPDSHIAKQIKEEFDCDEFAVTPAITGEEKNDLELLENNKEPKSFWPKSRQYSKDENLIKVHIKSGQTWARMILLTK